MQSPRIPPRLSLTLNQMLVDDGVAEDQVAAFLKNIWTANNNNRDRAAWVQRQVEHEQTRREEARTSKDGSSRSCPPGRMQEKQNQVQPHPRFPGSFWCHSSPLPLGASQMRKGAHCELRYFTNVGLKAAEKWASSQNDPDYIAVRRENDDSRALVVASTAGLPMLKSYGKNNASKPVLDEGLSWEDFIEVVPRVIISMRDSDWAED